MGSFFVLSATHLGLEVSSVRVEVDIASGLPAFQIVGLPDKAISESKDRVRAAIRNSGFSFPRTRVTVNLAPADVKKQGPAFDLPIAIAILAASGVIHCTDQLQNRLLLGELSLNGDLQPVNGVLLAATHVQQTKGKGIVVPEQNAEEAALVHDIAVTGIKCLSDIVHHCNEQTPFPLTTPSTPECFTSEYALTLADIRGQEGAKRALEIAAAGAHNLLLNGPPGSGKTMLARSLPSILPDLTFNEAMDITKVQSVAGLRRDRGTIVDARPFRSPHHSSSSVALIGGGAWPRPGEVSLAHRGVLFLDEFPEFPRAAIENLRQPLEDNFVTISRAAGTIQFPAQFMLVAAMNPCPCGFLTDPDKSCTCTPSKIMKYHQKISGPLLDRIDLVIEVPRVDFEKLTSETEGEAAKHIRKRVQDARDIQTKRYASENITVNAELSTKQLKQFAHLNEAGRAIIKQAVEKLNLSARAYTRVLKVARTIADLENEKNIEVHHLAEALQYRAKA